jgi:hypothetical protein
VRGEGWGGGVGGGGTLSNVWTLGRWESFSRSQAALNAADIPHCLDIGNLGPEEQQQLVEAAAHVRGGG